MDNTDSPLQQFPSSPLYYFHDNFRINGSLPALHFKNFPVVSYKLPEFKSRLLSHYLRVIRSVLGVTVSHFELVFFLSFSYIFPYWSKKAGAKMVLMNYSMILYRAQNIFEVEPNFMANFMNKELRIDGFIKHLGGRS